MLHILDYPELDQYPNLADNMFRDRADQFVRRLEWDISVDHDGHERDQYDVEGTTYLIASNDSENHLGSLRLRSACQPTMASEHFRELFDDGRWQPTTWEITRFVNTAGDPQIARLLALSAHTLARSIGLEEVIGVYGATMGRVYRRIGWPPTQSGSRGAGRTAINGGRWSIAERHGAQIRRKMTDGDSVSAYVTRACEAYARKRRFIDQIGVNEEASVTRRLAA